jgi:hypothetical protein
MCVVCIAAYIQRRDHVLLSYQPVIVGEGKLGIERIGRMFGTNNMCVFTI